MRTVEMTENDDYIKKLTRYHAIKLRIWNFLHITERK